MTSEDIKHQLIIIISSVSSSHFSSSAYGTLLTLSPPTYGTLFALSPPTYGILFALSPSTYGTLLALSPPTYGTLLALSPSASGTLLATYGTIHVLSPSTDGTLLALSPIHRWHTTCLISIHWWHTTCLISIHWWHTTCLIFRTNFCFTRSVYSGEGQPGSVGGGGGGRAGGRRRVVWGEGGLERRLKARAGFAPHPPSAPRPPTGCCSQCLRVFQTSKLWPKVALI